MQTSESKTQPPAGHGIWKRHAGPDGGDAAALLTAAAGRRNKQRLGTIEVGGVKYITHIEGKGQSAVMVFHRSQKPGITYRRPFTELIELSVAQALMPFMSATRTEAPKPEAKP